MKLVRELLSSKKFLAMLSAIVVYVVGRVGLDISPEALAPVWQAILVFVGAQGVADLGKGAAQVRAVAPPEVVVSTEFKTPSGAALVPLVLGAVAFAVISATSSCAEVRPRVAAATQAFVDCELPHLKAAATEAYELAEAALLSTISGSGTVDSVALKRALTGIKSDGLRCAVAAAVAAIATPVSTSARSATMAVDLGGMREAFARTAGELGWPVYRVAQ